MQRLYIAIAVLVAPGLAGCSDSAAPPAASKASQGSAVAPPTIDPATTRAISSTADAFMRAVLAGDSPSAARHLTAKAAARYATDASVLEVMGMPVEELRVGEVRLYDDEAAVQCLITPPGATAPEELCCLLKREASGWRVCGVASDVNGATPAVISFEDEPLATPGQRSQLVEEQAYPSATPRTAADPATAGEYR